MIGRFCSVINRLYFYQILDVISLEKADIFLLPMLIYNKSIIFEFIDIICKLAKWLKIINNIVWDKIILIKKDLMII